METIRNKKEILSEFHKQLNKDNVNDPHTALEVLNRRVFRYAHYGQNKSQILNELQRSMNHLRPIYEFKARLANKQSAEILKDVRKNMCNIKVNACTKDSLLKHLQRSLSTTKAEQDTYFNERQTILHNFALSFKRRRTMSEWKEDFASKLIFCPHPGCYRHFRSNRNVQRHLLIHAGKKPFECSVCKRQFRQNHDLKRHQRNEHSGGMKHACRFKKCECRFETSEELKEHYKIHYGPFKCAVSGCNEVFETKYLLKQHWQSHKDVYKFECARRGCCQRFKYKHQMEAHLVGHYGIKAHKCSYPGCYEQFALEEDARNHESAHYEMDCP